MGTIMKKEKRLYDFHHYFRIPCWIWNLLGQFGPHISCGTIIVVEQWPNIKQYVLVHERVGFPRAQCKRGQAVKLVNPERQNCIPAFGLCCCVDRNICAQPKYANKAHSAHTMVWVYRSNFELQFYRNGPRPATKIKKAQKMIIKWNSWSIFLPVCNAAASSIFNYYRERERERDRTRFDGVIAKFNYFINAYRRASRSRDVKYGIMVQRTCSSIPRARTPHKSHQVENKNIKTNVWMQLVSTEN